MLKKPSPGYYINMVVSILCESALRIVQYQVEFNGSNRGVFFMSICFRHLMALVFFFVMASAVGGEVNFATPEGHWISGSLNRGEAVLAADESGTVRNEFEFPGSGLIYYTIPVRYFRAQKAWWEKSRLKIDLQAEIISGAADAQLQAVIFVKDKNGSWFQSVEPLSVTAGKDFKTLEISLNPADKTLRPVGHDLQWNDFSRSIMNSIGVSFYSHDSATWRLACRQIRLDGANEMPPLAVREDRFPEQGRQNQLFQVDFQLSREYFNPFDPEEIAVDLEVIRPDGSRGRMPGFYNFNCRRKLINNEEKITLYGMPFWSVRYTPAQVGKYKFRLLASGIGGDGGSRERFVGPWRQMSVAESAGGGAIRVSSRNNRYFENSKGKFFFPVGMNIHSNIDRRSESQFNFGKLPDYGTFDYDEYFAAMKRAGMNYAEIWMSAWMTALEWNGALNNYYGVGRYNLHNAWKLDYLLSSAARNDIYINLALDNHGKFSVRVDSEWRENPYNINNLNNLANGGFIVDINRFFSDERVSEALDKRNRYIIARYGAFQNIFAFELLSEGDLTNHQGPEVLRDWNRERVNFMRSIYDGTQMFVSHVCGDCDNNVAFRVMFEAPELDFVAGDAYRNNNHIVDQLLKHRDRLDFFAKPILITEYGGSHMGGAVGNIRADIHGGLWGSLFTRQGGAPMLWWHDFIHKNNLYPHYAAFVNFISDIEMRDFNFRVSERVKLSEIAVSGYPYAPAVSGLKNLLLVPELTGVERFNFLPLPEDSVCEGFAAGTQDYIFGWVYNRRLLYDFPAQAEYLKFSDTGWRGEFNLPLDAGFFSCEIYDTLNGQLRAVGQIFHSGGCLKLDLPPFQADAAFKLKRINYVE